MLYIYIEEFINKIIILVTEAYESSFIFYVGGCCCQERLATSWALIMTVSVERLKIANA